MGMDKEAMDIWKFGRPRPDMSLDEVAAAPEPAEEQKAERHKMLAARAERMWPEWRRKLIEDGTFFIDKEVQTNGAK